MTHVKDRMLDSRLQLKNYIIVKHRGEGGGEIKGGVGRGKGKPYTYKTV